LLSGYGYRPKMAQTAHSLLGIRLTISLYPAILYCVIVGALCFYSIGKKRNLQIQDELAERRRRVESSPGV